MDDKQNNVVDATADLVEQLKDTTSEVAPRMDSNISEYSDPGIPGIKKLFNLKEHENVLRHKAKVLAKRRAAEKRAKKARKITRQRAK